LVICSVSPISMKAKNWISNPT